MDLVLGTAQSLVTVCTTLVLLVQITLPPGLTEAAGNGAELLVILTFTSVSAAAVDTSTVPVIGA